MTGPGETVKCCRAAVFARLFEMRTCYPLVPQARTAARGMGQELITASSVCVCMCVISPLGDEGDWGE